MIKKIVIILIILNLAFFTWLMTMGNTLYIPPSSNEEGIPSLTLIPANESDVASANQTTSCFTFGPFDNGTLANQISNKIANLGFTTIVNAKETMQILNYFVYLQPFNSREEALAVIAEMSKHEIKQYNLIEDGAYKNAIGLGSFDNIDEARRHAEYVRFLGYDGRYTNEKAHKEVYWINYNVPVGESIPVLQWTKEIAPQSNPQIIPESC